VFDRSLLVVDNGAEVSVTVDPAKLSNAKQQDREDFRLCARGAATEERDSRGKGLDLSLEQHKPAGPSNVSLW